MLSTKWNFVNFFKLIKILRIIILNSQESLEITSQMIQTTSDNHVKTGKTHGEMSLLRKITPTISIQIDKAIIVRIISDVMMIVKTIIVRIISDVMMIVKATISPVRTILKTGSRAVDFLNESRGKTTMSNEETSTKDKTTFDLHAKTIRTAIILAGERIKTTTMNRETILALSSSILQILSAHPLQNNSPMIVRQEEVMTGGKSLPIYRPKYLIIFFIHFL